MGGYGILVLTDTALLHVETRETEEFLLKDAEIFVGYLAHEELLGVTGITRILVAVFDVIHPLDEEFLGNT